MKPIVREHPLVVDPQSLDGCSCGGEHPAPQVTLYSAADACRIMAEDCRTAYGDRPVFLLSDPDTHAAAGDRLQQELVAQGINLTACRLDADPEADDATVDMVRDRSKGAALIISVGSGTVGDLGKYSATQENIDFWCMPTAPSMNGYTSGIAAIKVRGVKRTLKATPAQRLYVVPEVIQQAPLKLRQAGFCDVLAKAVSDVDWQCESLLFSHSYCRLPAGIMTTIEHTYNEHPEEIGRGDAKAVQGLFEGLLISGVAMSLIGTSAPASGGEHLISHFWDMREPLTGRTPELHGLQVGVGIIVSTACYSALANLDKRDLPCRAEQAFAEDAARIPGLWGDYAAEVAAQFNNKRAALMQFDSLVPANWENLQALFRKVRPPEYFADMFSRVGAPFSLEAFRLDKEEFMLAALNARTIRERITVLDFAAHAGVLEAAAERALSFLN